MMNLEWAYSSCPNDSKATIDTKEKVTRLDFILDYYKLSGTWSDNASMLLYIAWRGKVIISSVLAQEIWENWQSNEYLSSNRDDFFAEYIFRSSEDVTYTQIIMKYVCQASWIRNTKCMILKLLESLNDQCNKLGFVLNTNPTSENRHISWNNKKILDSTSTERLLNQWSLVECIDDTPSYKEIFAEFLFYSSKNELQMIIKEYIDNKDGEWVCNTLAWKFYTNPEQKNFDEECKNFFASW